MASKPYNATVVDRIDISPGLMILRIEPDEKRFDFSAGQYTVLGLNKTEPLTPEVDPKVDEEDKTSPEFIQRAYSIASSSKPGEFLEFYLTLVPSGALTPRLFHLQKGSRLYVSNKAVGLFTLDRIPQGLHAILVGTGTGLAPYMSMLRSQLVCGGERKFIIVHGARYSWDLGYRSQLEALSKECPNVFYFPSITRAKEDPSWRGLTGYLQDVLFSGVVEKHAGITLGPKDAHVFLCGNPGMIEMATKKLIDLGHTPDKGKVSGTLHTEEYW